MSESEVTKLVGNRIANARAVAQALEVQGVEAAPTVSKLIFPDGEPRHLTIAAFIAALGPALLRFADAMADAERKLVNEYADDGPYRDARDTARSALRAELISAGSSIAGAYDDATRAHYHLDVALPADDDRLLQHARSVHEALKHGAPSKPAKKGRSVDFRVLAAEVQDCITPFAASLVDVAREAREAQRELSARDAAVAAFEPVYTGIADIGAGILELAGRSEHANRVKPTQRRRAGLDAPAAPPNAGTSNSA